MDTTDERVVEAVLTAFYAAVGAGCERVQCYIAAVDALSAAYPGESRTATACKAVSIVRATLPMVPERVRH
jgi:hypothetical protein